MDISNHGDFVQINTGRATIQIPADGLCAIWMEHDDVDPSQYSDIVAEVAESVRSYLDRPGLRAEWDANRSSSGWREVALPAAEAVEVRQ